MSKTYLGDSVYVFINGAGQLVLTTENGFPDDPSNTIYMEPEVYQALVSYVNRVMVEPKEDPSITADEADDNYRGRRRGGL